jgi:FKBP-type peptidyl-prolyl cis-trans isomerase
VIDGLDRGVSHLSIGEKAKITVPPNLGYEQTGFPGLIPPSTTICFEIELVDIEINGQSVSKAKGGKKVW